MYLKNDEHITYAIEDYIMASMYSYDSARIQKWQIEKLINFYFANFEISEFLDIDEFTDWVHELEDEEIKEIADNN